MENDVCPICGLVAVGAGQVCVGCAEDLDAILMDRNTRRLDGVGLVPIEDDVRGLVAVEGASA